MLEVDGPNTTKAMTLPGFDPYDHLLRLTTVSRPVPSVSTVTRVSTFAPICHGTDSYAVTAHCYSWDGQMALTTDRLDAMVHDIVRVADYLELAAMADAAEQISQLWDRTGDSHHLMLGHRPRRLIFLDQIDAEPWARHLDVATGVAARCLYDAGAWASDVLIVAGEQPDGDPRRRPWRHNVVTNLGLRAVDHDYPLYAGTTSWAHVGDVIVDAAR